MLAPPNSRRVRNGPAGLGGAIMSCPTMSVVCVRDGENSKKVSFKVANMYIAACISTLLPKPYRRSLVATLAPKTTHPEAGACSTLKYVPMCACPLDSLDFLPFTPTSPVTCARRQHVGWQHACRLLILHHLKETASRMQPKNRTLSPSHPIEGLPTEAKSKDKKSRR